MSIDKWIGDKAGFLSAYEWDGDKVTRALFEPRAKATLEHNKRVQNSAPGGVLPDTPLGRCVLSMEEVDRRSIARLFPDIDAPDAETRNRAWRKFMQSPLSAPYKVGKY